MKVKKVPASQRLRILLSNGRFPVALDLARQLHKVGHTVYVVDPMHFHITTFSRSVKKSFQVPAPHESSTGYIDCIRKAVVDLRIQLIIPMHEEGYHLAQVDDLRPITFVAPYHTLIALHNKWHFYQLVTYAGLLVPPTTLINSMDDARKLDLSKEYALKPAFGRALSGIHHYKPGDELPELQCTEDVPYIAQEWITGKQLCSYAVARNGEIKAACVYPVIDTIDGSSCVFFQSVDHPGIMRFMDVMAATYNITGQIAFDFIEAPNGGLYALECNPRATSGIHLFNKTPWLAEAFTNPNAPRRNAQIGKKMQMMPGMLMWEPKENSKHEKVQHTRRLFGTHDILFRLSDPFPAFLQPFLYATYVKQCHEKKLELKELFQWDVVWEPRPDEIQRVRDEMRMANDNVTKAVTSVTSATSSTTPEVFPAMPQNPQAANAASGAVPEIRDSPNYNATSSNSSQMPNYNATSPGAPGMPSILPNAAPSNSPLANYNTTSSEMFSALPNAAHSNSPLANYNATSYGAQAPSTFNSTSSATITYLQEPFPEYKNANSLGQPTVLAQPAQLQPSLSSHPTQPAQPAQPSLISPPSVRSPLIKSFPTQQAQPDPIMPTQ